MRNIYEGLYPLGKENAVLIPRLYASVFAGEPWKEVSRCPICGSFSGTDRTEAVACSTLGCRGTYSEEAYPEYQTRKYITAELSRPDAQGQMQVRMEDIRRTIEEVLAFGWGYRSAGIELARDKYKSEEMRQIITDLLAKTGAFFYISEVGVEPAARGKKYGKGITTALASVGKQKFGTVVLRTNVDSPMRLIAQGLGMTPILGTQAGIRDAENEQRVLFVGGAYERK